MERLEVGQRVRLALAPEIAGTIVEVLDVPGDELYMVDLDGAGDPAAAVCYSRAVLKVEG